MKYLGNEAYQQDILVNFKQEFEWWSVKSYDFAFLKNIKSEYFLKQIFPSENVYLSIMIAIPICNTNKEHQSGLQYFLNKLMKNQTTSKSSHQSCSIERAVLKNFGNSHRKTHVPESLILQPQPRTLLKKKTLA